MNHFKVVIDNLANGNYHVSVSKNGTVVIQRAYTDLREIISLIPLVYGPKHGLRNIQESGKDAEQQNNRD
jgi:hypothetical protein